MTIGTIIGIIILLLLIVWAAYYTARKFKKGGGCCGEHEQAQEKTVVQDRNKAHYPYEISVKIGGMTCGNCAVKVENALNSLDGVWARVSIDTHTAQIRSKNEPDMKLYAQAVQKAGYVILP